ncbi:MAG: hypothetical protein R2838_13815 [Caldilineaceae bacterium]
MLFGAVLQAGLGLVQFVLQIGPEWFIIMGRFMRASGTFRQPNPFAGYLGLTLPVAVSLALWGWAAFWRTRTAAARSSAMRSSPAGRHRRGRCHRWGCWPVGAAAAGWAPRPVWPRSSSSAAGARSCSRCWR